MLPVAVVERIEVLNDGASSVYGSDAIGGVVNIITRTQLPGCGIRRGLRHLRSETTASARSYHAVFGQTTDKGSIMIGFQYDKQDPVSAANRKFSHSAQYIYNTGINTHGGSSRTPGGRFFVPAGSPLIATQLGLHIE